MIVIITRAVPDRESLQLWGSSAIALVSRSSPVDRQLAQRPSS